MNKAAIIFLLVSIVVCVILYFIYRKVRGGKYTKPEALKYWGVLYFGNRGSGKTLHQADQIMDVVRYWAYLWKIYPKVRHGIILTNQILSQEGLDEIAKYTTEKVYYHFDDGEEMHFCPRVNCWRGTKKHILHGALIVLDDISTFLPADNWQQTPYWMRKQWTQAQHLGLHFLFNCQEPTAYDINARRATALCYKFTKLVGSDRPDETAKEIKFIWGVYKRYKVKAAWLWKFGDLEPEQIADLKEGLKAKAEMTGKPSPFRNIFKSSPHLITEKKSMRYDTLQDVKEYEPKGYIGVKQFDCIDLTHNHTDKTNLDIPYTTFKKAEHELI